MSVIINAVRRRSWHKCCHYCWKDSINWSKADRWETSRLSHSKEDVDFRNKSSSKRNRASQGGWEVDFWSSWRQRIRHLFSSQVIKHDFVHEDVETSPLRTNCAAKPKIWDKKRSVNFHPTFNSPVWNKNGILVLSGFHFKPY